MDVLSIVTDDEVEIIFPFQQRGTDMAYNSVVISSGHGKYVRGASGILDEVDEARKVVERVAEELRSRSVNVTTYHDDVSQSQNKKRTSTVSSTSTIRRRAISMLQRAASTPMRTDKPMAFGRS